MANRQRPWAIVVSLASVLSLLLTACGGAPSGGDPVSVVKAAMAAVTSKQFDKLSELACAAKKDSVTSQLNPAAALTGQGLGKEDVQKLLDAMTISFDNAEFGTPTITGDSASIPMKGKMSMKFDREKLKGVLKSMLATQGLANATDDQINQALDMVAGQLEQGQQVDTTVDLIKENGKWVICTK
jgi:hypothetical protein